MRDGCTLACVLMVVASPGCTGTTVEHEHIPQEHSIEYFSFSEVEAAYAAGLIEESEALVTKYQPGEEISAQVEIYAEETGMWGGIQTVALEVRSIRLPERGKCSDDHLAVAVAIWEADRELHRMEIAHKIDYFDAEWGEIFSSDRAMRDLIGAVAWRIVYEMTPPGFDEAIICAGHGNGIRPATVEAGRRGFLSYGEALKAASENKFDTPTDAYCAGSLAKPSWLPWWLWDFGYKKCEARAREAAKRGR